MPITITGMDAVIAKLRRLDNLGPTLRPVLHRSQMKLQKALKVYPPPPASSRYTRTFKLRGSWQIKPIQFSANDARAEVYSDGSARTRYGQYERYVMDAQKQAWMHRGRWHTTKSVEEKLGPEIIRDVKNALTEAVNK